MNDDDAIAVDPNPFLRLSYHAHEKKHFPTVCERTGERKEFLKMLIKCIPCNDEYSCWVPDRLTFLYDAAPHPFSESFSIWCEVNLVRTVELTLLCEYACFLKQCQHKSLAGISVRRRTRRNSKFESVSIPFDPCQMTTFSMSLFSDVVLVYADASCASEHAS